MHKKSEETVKTASPTAAESKIIEDAKNDKEWEHGAGIKSQNKNDKAYIQTDAQV